MSTVKVFRGCFDSPIYFDEVLALPFLVKYSVSFVWRVSNATGLGLGTISLEAAIKKDKSVGAAADCTFLKSCFAGVTLVSSSIPSLHEVGVIEKIS